MSEFGTFTNPQWYDLSDAEITAQQKIMEPLRDKHMRELIESGAATRIKLGSTALSRFAAYEDSFTEGTMLYPFRNRFWNLPSWQAHELLNGVGRGVFGSKWHNDSFVLSTADPQDQSFSLAMGRFEPTAGGYATGGYHAGIMLNSSHASRLGVDQLQPIQGVEASDLSLLMQQLEEIRALADEKNLTAIDRVTLSEGHGEMLR